MTIVVECPHCDSQFNLLPDLAGKSMRCPNSDCREIFVVQPKVATTVVLPPPPPVIPPPPLPAEEPLVPILEGESVTFEKTAAFLPSQLPRSEPKPAPNPYLAVEPEPLVPILEGEPTSPTPAAEELVPDMIDDDEPAVVAEVLEEPVAGPKVVDWRKAAPPPVAEPEEKPSPKRLRREREESEEEIVLPNRRGPGIWKYVLVGLVALSIGGVIYYFVQSSVNEANKEKQLAEDAEKEFKNQNYTLAVKNYDQLQAEFPTSSDMPKYQFFGKLSDVHTAVSSVTARDNPAEAQKKFEAFLTEYKDSPLSKPTDTGYGFDVFEAGRKLVDAYAENADQNLNTFLKGRKKRELIDVAEQSVAAGRALLPLVEKYRIKEVKPLDDQRKRFDDLSAKFARERERLRVIDPYRDLTKDPTDQRIFEFVVILKQARFDTDEEALQLIADAKAELRRLIRGVQELRPPVAPPSDPAGGLLFVSSPLGQSSLPVIVPADVTPEVFFATVRGILYAFDPESGTLLWATRVGRSVCDVPARVPERPGLPELVLVPLDRDGFGLTGRVARTGEAKWHQPLEAPIAGQPIVVNTRVYVPLRDELGTIVEIEAVTGNRLSHIHLRQRIGPGGVRQPGSGMIFVAAEARRVFAINTEPFDAEGNRQPVQCVQVMATDHPDLSLKVPPVVTGPTGEAKANRFIILAQTDGTQSSKMRAFPIVPAGPVDPAVGPPEIVPPLAGSVGLPGHILFPPHTDGERVAVATDAGAFGLFGTNQPGNQDANIYAIPSVALPVDLKVPMAGQVISAEEDTFWAVSRSKLYRLRLGLTPTSGLQVNTAGLPLTAGIPIQNPQLNARREIAFIVVRSEDSDGVRAMAFDPRNGRPRWQRKVGVAPQSRPIPLGQTATALADEDGGGYVLPSATTDDVSKTTTTIPAAWVVAPPVAAAAAPAQMCATADGRSVWVLIPETGEKQTLRLRVRHLVDGKPQADELVQLPGLLAGPPVASGPGVVFPCTDGFLHRFEPNSPKLQQGPMWRAGENSTATDSCFVSSISADEFLATDGGKSVTRWRWASATDWKAVAGPWTLREKIPFAPVVVSISANERRLFVADPSGNVWMYDADVVGEPIRRWRTAKDDPDNSIPAGKPTTGFVVGNSQAGIVIAYFVENRHIVAIAPGSEKAAWVVRRLGAADTLGGVSHGSAFLFTDISGIVTAYDQITGEKLGSIRSENKDLLPRTPAIPVGNGKSLIVPMLDGSVVLLPNPG